MVEFWVKIDVFFARKNCQDTFGGFVERVQENLACTSFFRFAARVDYELMSFKKSAMANPWKGVVKPPEIKRQLQNMQGKRASILECYLRFSFARQLAKT